MCDNLAFLGQPLIDSVRPASIKPGDIQKYSRSSRERSIKSSELGAEAALRKLNRYRRMDPGFERAIEGFVASEAEYLADGHES